MNNKFIKNIYMPISFEYKNEKTHIVTQKMHRNERISFRLNSIEELLQL